MVYWLFVHFFMVLISPSIFLTFSWPVEKENKVGWLLMFSLLKGNVSVSSPEDLVCDLYWPVIGWK